MATFDELLAAAAAQFEANRPLLPMYLHLLLSALFPIYTGAHASLSRPSSAAKQAKKSKADSDDDDDENTEDDDEEETRHKMEGLTPRDAIIFPFTAGIVLAGLYWLIKTYGASVINTVLGIYFSLIGTYSVGKLINDSWSTLASFLMPTYYRDQGKIWRLSSRHRKVTALDSEEPATRTSPLVGTLGRLPLPDSLLSLSWSLRDFVKQKFKVDGYAKELFDFKAIVTRHNATSAVLGVIAISYSLLVDKPWWLTNLQGFAVCYGALQLLSPTTFATGTLILSGLFFYDIWAVFFTPLMVTVAKNLDVPIKLVFPRPDDPVVTPGAEKPPRSYSMLGLGDIVLPGLIIALALRFDLYMFYLRKQKKVQKQVCEGDVCTLKEEVEKEPYVNVTGNWGEKLWTGGGAHLNLPTHLSTTFPKPYFTATIVGYVVGMIATLVCMSIFQHAQPALLYLVPGVLISVWGTGLVRGELKQMWNFTEAITGEAADEDQSEEKANETKRESKGFFADLWAELFGSAEDGQEKDKEEGDVEKKQRPGHEIFSFTITHNKRFDKEVSGPDVDAKQKRSSSPEGSEDAVLVSNKDLDGASEESKPRLRSQTKRGISGKVHSK